MTEDFDVEDFEFLIVRLDDAETTKGAKKAADQADYILSRQLQGWTVTYQSAASDEPVRPRRRSVILKRRSVKFH